MYTVFNFNVLSNYQNHCMAMPILYHMYAVTMATNCTFKFSSFMLPFTLHSLWCVLITYVYWNMHYVLNLWEILIVIKFVHPHNKISPITKVTGPWIYQNLIVSLISANTATGSWMNPIQQKQIINIKIIHNNFMKINSSICLETWH